MAGSATYKQSRTVCNCVVLQGQFVYSVYSVTRVCLFHFFRHKMSVQSSEFFLFYVPSLSSCVMFYCPLPVFVCFQSFFQLTCVPLVNHSACIEACVFPSLFGGLSVFICIAVFFILFTGPVLPSCFTCVCCLCYTGLYLIY